jgi:hypothetical protein
MTTFRTTIELSGKSATGLPVPPEALDALGGGKRPAVVVTLAGYAYRSTVGTMGGRAMVPLSAEHRAGAGVGAGDEVDVELVLDTAPRVVEPPEDLAAALAAAPGARAAFDALAPSRRKAIVTGVEGAKAADTRARRVARAVAELGGA